MNVSDFISIVSPYTMTSLERIEELYNSLEYIRINNIKGDFVECGVWKGGNILGIASYLEFHKMHNRKIWAYDTFQGMTPPEDIDVDLNNNKASNILSNVLCFSPLEEVTTNVFKSTFPKEKIHFIVGDVCSTLLEKNNLPKKISLLRLDTDWYQSTKTEMEILYPLLTNKGVLIVDDYGHWKGAKQAIDEYFQNQNIKINKIDYTGIKIIKNEIN